MVAVRAIGMEFFIEMEKPSELADRDKVPIRCRGALSIYIPLTHTTPHDESLKCAPS